MKIFKMSKTNKENYLWCLIVINIWQAGVSIPTTYCENWLDASNEITDPRAEYAAVMLSFMDLTINPCDDFYEYACGNWRNVIKPRHSETKRNYLTDIDYELSDFTENILRKDSIEDIAPEYEYEFQLAKQFYFNCLEEDLLTKRKSYEYIQVLQSIGGFPALDPYWDSDSFSWVQMSAHMSNYGINGLFKDGTISEYPFKPYFDFPSFGFDIELHTDSIKNCTSNPYRKNYERMHEILTLYQVPEENIAAIIGDIFEFLTAVFQVFEEVDENEYKCKDHLTLFEESDQELINNTVVEQLKNYLEIAWLDREREFDDAYKPCEYLYYKLEFICDEHKEAVANYLSMKFIYGMDPQLDDASYQTEYCTSRMRNSMIYLFDHLYMRMISNDQAIEEVDAMIDEIKHNLRTIIEEADWLDEDSRKEALLKESMMGKVIGRYEDSEMTSRLIEEIRNLEFIPGNYEANNLNLKKFQQSMDRYNGLHHLELDNTTKPLELLVGMQANAFYFNTDNSMYVMAGVLNPPMFQKDWPNSLKYGTLGYLVGHELTHAFDTVGAKYDHTGSEHYWWSEKSGEMFRERAQCFVDYFDRYYIPEINRNINGNVTRDENIADAGGLRLALLTYRRLMEKQAAENNDLAYSTDSEERMPGLDLTPEQLFFLGTAQVWCSAYEEAHYWEGLSDDHTIDKYRVLGMLSNNADFANAYNCPLGSEMNPTDYKCAIW
ncbi:neprilysin-1-like [Haematobia irritans]|uniref:neprilysin-1-like n=1 Tax=Haematobia irritans TaxID=7368 RepID=UPI003F4F7355